MKADIKEYTLEDLEKEFIKKSLPKFTASQVFSWVYKKRVEDFSLMTDISKVNRHILFKNFYFSKIKILKREVSEDKTEKFLFGLADDTTIESVLIPAGSRNTLCISSQVGCKFFCKFCVSGKFGFRRNLAVSEMVNQYLAIYDLISPAKITNIVFMGVGEPLDNFLNVVKTIKIFTEPKGIYLGKSKICISTCGLLPQIEELIKLNLDVELSISLHSPFSKIRSSIMPVNKIYPIEKLIEIAKKFSKINKKPVTFEYILIKDLNTTKTDALRLAKLLKGFSYKLNLIPYHPNSFCEFKSPLQNEIKDFTSILKEKKVFFTLRKSRGKDINAACGQLRAYFGGKV
ncbi:MAG: 23S rRNA (adenine(2503)-C(2))-methyltransferase RlmN [Candidatus Omnitrophica bacterium]|nr:23S rRNA (adenine(2503)-C(2))-methyltransferase RlmN [Candidatus Omnitrophota bacterium]